MPPKPALRDLLLGSDRFITAVELVTSRGVIANSKGRRVLALARELAPHPRIDVLSITDNPAGHAMLSADTIGTDLLSRGQEVIIHLACKDWNRNALESRAWKLASEGFHNVLALSGDYPTGGYRGLAAPVFDIDSVGLLRMYADIEDGQFFLGCATTNHKRHENEVMPQLFKLRKKLANGAQFVITQIGYHARKDAELLRWLADEGLDVPVLANVYVLSRRAAQAFHAGRVPGVRVTDELLALFERETASADGGRGFLFDFAARQIVVARGLGFRGAYLGGHLDTADYLEILDRADAYAPDDWRELAKTLCFPERDEFHLYEQDPETLLAAPEVNRAYRARPHRRGDAPLSYRVSRAMHDAVFAPDAPLQRVGRGVYRGAEAGPVVVRKAMHVAEQAIKAPLFGCRDCGDCSLPDIAYLCPESQCAKNQRNGPCGGTREDSRCEVGDKTCIWALAYDRLKAYGEETTMLDGPVVIKDNALRHSSAWANAFLQRDHHADHHHRERERS